MLVRIEVRPVPVYLNVDADFLYRPRTAGNARVGQELYMNPARFVEGLKKAGLSWIGTRVTLFTDHKEAYFVWKELGGCGTTLVHVDAHSDASDGFSWLVHCGNYLLHAMKERMFSKILWVLPDWLWETDDWLRYDVPAGAAIKRRGRSASLTWERIEFRAVPFGDFVMPNARVSLVTVATSPLFVPRGSLGVIRELVERICEGAGAVDVRPSPPACLRDPRLLRYMKADLASCGPTRHRTRKGEALGFLWVEHELTEKTGGTGSCTA